MYVDEEGMPQPASQPTQAPSSTRLTQASQKRREETSGNHRAEVFEQTEPTLAEQLSNIQPPRVAHQSFPMTSSDTGDETMPPGSKGYSQTNHTQAIKQQFQLFWIRQANLKDIGQKPVEPVEVKKAQNV